MLPLPNRPSLAEQCSLLLLLAAAWTTMHKHCHDTHRHISDTSSMLRLTATAYARLRTFNGKSPSEQHGSLLACRRPAPVRVRNSFVLSQRPMTRPSHAQKANNASTQLTGKPGTTTKKISYPRFSCVSSTIRASTWFESRANGMWARDHLQYER